MGKIGYWQENLMKYGGKRSANWSFDNFRIRSRFNSDIIIIGGGRLEGKAAGKDIGDN